MALKLKWFVFVLVISSSNLFGQFYEAIGKNSVNYFLSLAHHNTKTEHDFEKLKSSLYSEIDIKELEKTYQVTKNDLDSLKNHFTEYGLTLKNISSDSALVIYNQWYLHFCNAFHNYSEEKFFSSNKTKILFFSASVSCPCTLEMCRKQTTEILNLVNKNNLEYWVIDSYVHNELQIKYETLFAPSILILDEKNNVIFKIEYDENLLVKVNKFIESKLKG